MRDNAHRRDQRAADQGCHLLQNCPVQLGAMVVEKPRIGLSQVTGQKPPADAVVPHLGEAGIGVKCRDLDGQAEDQHRQHPKAQHDQEGLIIHPAEPAVQPGQIAILPDLTGVRDHCQKGKDRGNAQHVDEGHHDDQDKKKKKTQPLTVCQKIKKLAVSIEHSHLLQKYAVLSFFLQIAGWSRRIAERQPRRPAMQDDKSI